MPRAEILSKQALHALTQLHAESARKIETNRKSGDKLRSQMVQVDAVMKMLHRDFNARSISPKRRNTGNPWFKRGTLERRVEGCQPYNGAPDIRRAVAGKTPTATRKQEAAVGVRGVSVSAQG